MTHLELSSDTLHIYVCLRSKSDVHDAGQRNDDAGGEDRNDENPLALGQMDLPEQARGHQHKGDVRHGVHYELSSEPRK